MSLSAIAFDVHLAEIFVPWKQGFAVTTAPRAELLEDLAQGIDVVQATHVGCVPSLIEATLGRLPGGIGRVKYLTSGGEKMTDSVRFVLRHHLHKLTSMISVDIRKLGRQTELSTGELLWSK